MSPIKTSGDSPPVPSDKEYFDRRGRVIQIWRIRSADLCDAARLVWQGGWIQQPKGDGVGDESPWIHGIQKLYRPAQLLMGLCLEASLKGLLVERDPTLVSDGKIAGELNTHSLEGLFNEASIPLKDTEEELNLVRRLSDAVQWVAKYPVPLKAHHLTSPKHKSKNPLMQNDLDFDRFEALRKRIDDEFKTPLPRR